MQPQWQSGTPIDPHDAPQSGATEPAAGLSSTAARAAAQAQLASSAAPFSDETFSDTTFSDMTSTPVTSATEPSASEFSEFETSSDAPSAPPMPPASYMTAAAGAVISTAAAHTASQYAQSASAAESNGSVAFAANASNADFAATSEPQVNAGAGTAANSAGAATATKSTRPNSSKKSNGKKKEEDVFTWRDALIWISIPVLIVLLLRFFVVGMYVIPSGSMENTIMPGDRVITNKLDSSARTLKRGDIVVFKDPDNWLSNEGSKYSSDYLIKRLIGLPGDTVACAGSGSPITINGVAIDESSYLKPGVEPSDFAFSITVTAGHVFVLGDNRANSADSRYHMDDDEHGLVPISNIEGVAFAKYWPLSAVGWLSAHTEVFKNVPDADAAPDASENDSLNTIHDPSIITTSHAIENATHNSKYVIKKYAY